MSEENVKAKAAAAETDAQDVAEQAEDEFVDPIEAEAARKAAEEKVVCYLSKRSVPISDTVEVKYNNDGFFRVQKHLVKF